MSRVVVPVGPGLDPVTRALEQISCDEWWCGDGISAQQPAQWRIQVLLMRGPTIFFFRKLYQQHSIKVKSFGTLFGLLKNYKTHLHIGLGLHTLETKPKKCKV